MQVFGKPVCRQAGKNASFSLYMAEKAGHQWYIFIDRALIDLGKGDRSIVKNGVYASAYQITIPQELNRL
jgi:hypothetical protein